MCNVAILVGRDLNENHLRDYIRCERNVSPMANEKKASQDVEGDFLKLEKLNSHYDTYNR